MSDSHPETGAPLEFEFDGRTIRAEPGQTLAGALHQAGEFILSRSFKYHRPRGFFCGTGRCPNCMCTVNGTPNVRICTQPAEPGAVVKTQNSWPSARFDLLSILDRLHKFMPVGFYYKSMFKPRWMWPVWERFIRRIAGLGRVDRRHGAAGVYDKVNQFCDVAVIGGGWAGLNAAREAARAGLSVVLIDDQTELGGHLRVDPEAASAEFDAVIRDVQENPAIQVLNRATVFGLYDEHYLGIQCGERMIRLRAQEVIVATGGWERPLVFENNDLPGVMLASAAQRLLQLEHCRLDGRAVVVTDNAQGYRVARQLARAGTEIAAIIDVRSISPQSEFPVLSDRSIAAALGSDHVTGAVACRDSGQPLESIPCRWIIQAVGFTPAVSLLYQSGAVLEYNEQLDQPLVKSQALGTHAAGAVNGWHDATAAAVDGRRAGLAAAANLRPHDSHFAAERDGLAADLAGRRSTEKSARHYVSPATAKKKFVCLCEDVTEVDLCRAVQEGYSNIETLKRYSTVCMGPCQGKMCQGASIAICARENQQTIVDTGVTTSRPPEQPVPLGLLAGRALHFSLVRRTPL
ncbi:MAG: (2Fe-2S)-binding protein, partial [Planctomycetes bacterium]|nr:(2Fe-2S)-binding protein [Planctomycetota bacterium]